MGKFFGYVYLFMQCWVIFQYFYFHTFIEYWIIFGWIFLPIHSVLDTVWTFLPISFSLGQIFGTHSCKILIIFGYFFFTHLIHAVLIFFLFSPLIFATVNFVLGELMFSKGQFYYKAATGISDPCNATHKIFHKD